MEKRNRLHKRLISEYSDLIKNYLYKYPLLSYRRLSQLIIKENKIPIAPNTLRQVIPIIQNNIINKPEPISLDDEEFVFNVPPTDYEEFEHFKIPAMYDRMLVISDLHIPYHSIEPIKIAMKEGKNFGINSILINGDLIDFYQISKYYRKPTKKGIKDEINLTKQFLEEIKTKFKNVKIFYKYGNHEARWDKYIVSNAPQIFEIDNIKLEDILGLIQYNVDWIDDKRVIEFGHLNIIHGDEIIGGGINNARNKRLKANDNILFGHHHRTQEDITRTIKGKNIGSWAVGCLCGLEPNYMPINDWTNGFALLSRNKDDTFTVQNKKIINGIVR